MKPLQNHPYPDSCGWNIGSLNTRKLRIFSPGRTDTSLLRLWAASSEIPDLQLTNFNTPYHLSTWHLSTEEPWNRAEPPVPRRILGTAHGPIEPPKAPCHAPKGRSPSGFSSVKIIYENLLLIEWSGTENWLYIETIYWFVIRGPTLF